MHTKYRRLGQIWSLVFVCTAAASIAPQSSYAGPVVPYYSVVPLGPNTYGTALNNSGEITGYYYPSRYPIANAFLYSNGTLTNLGTFGGPLSFGYGINSSGEVTGAADTPPIGTVDTGGDAFIYANNTLQNLGCVGGSGSYCSSVGLAINDSGEVTGISGSDTAFLDSNGSVQTFGGPGSVGSGINNSGEVTGSFGTANGARAFIYSNGSLQDLGTLGGSVSTGTGINASGEVTGWSATSTSIGLYHAFLYSAGSMKDLGSLGPDLPSKAFGINDSGEVTGWAYTLRYGPASQHGFLYADDQMLDLNFLIGSEASLYTMISGEAINDDGQIVVDGIVNATYQPEAFLLTPIPNTEATPEPGTLGLLILGLTSMGPVISRRRRLPKGKAARRA